MQQRRPFFKVPWHDTSDQPQRVFDRELKQSLRLQSLPCYLRMLAVLVLYLPLLLIAYVQQSLRKKHSAPRRRDFLGVAISPPRDDTQKSALREAVADLGVRHLSIRVNAGERELEDDLAFINEWSDYQVLVTLCFDRRLVCEDLYREHFCRELFYRLPAHACTVQVGNAINRLKWGCSNVDEYLQVAEDIARIAAEFPHIALIGSSVIDFEPAVTLASLIHRRQVRWQACAALLYVDRRGSPYNRQYGLFATEEKIRTVSAMLACSRRCDPRLWITEVNWPLRGHGEWAPTSGQECVDEDSAAQFLEEYCQIAYGTGLVERVYVWQMVARGYGLIDDSEGDLRRRPAYAALQSWLSQGLSKLCSGLFLSSQFATRCLVQGIVLPSCGYQRFPFWHGICVATGVHLHARTTFIRRHAHDYANNSRG